MTMIFLKTALVSLSVLAAAPITDAQSATSEARRPMANPPRTLNGYPDLQGSWTNESVTRLERTGQTDKLVIPPEEVRKMEEESFWVSLVRDQEDAFVDTSEPLPTGRAANIELRGYPAFWLESGVRFGLVKGEYRSSWITEPENGRLPRKPGTGRSGGFGSGPGSADGPEIRNVGERCLSQDRNGPVMVNSFYNNNYQIVQTSNHVMILPEMIMDPRIIPIVAGPDEVEHLPDVIMPWFGDSVGWYEGDTLVVETVNTNPKQDDSLLSPTGRMIERFTRWSDDQILYEFEVDDPEFYTQTWKGEMSLDRFDEKIFEFACHEGNYSLPGILSGARYDERNAGGQK